MVIRAVLELVAAAPVGPAEIDGGIETSAGDTTSVSAAEAAALAIGVEGGRRWEIHGPTTVGRSDTADLTLTVASLSRRHAELVDVAGRLALRDLGSRNGTAVNGEVVGEEPVILADNDEIVLGGAVALRFIDPMATPIGPRIGRLTGVWIDPRTDAVWLDARLVEPPLSARQLQLLRLLDEADGAVVTREQIVAEVWADAAAEGVSDQALAALIKRLRQRLGSPSGSESDVIEIVRGRGLRLRRAHQTPG